MKKLIILFLSVICLASCHGQSDEGYEKAPEEFTGPYTLEADKESIESNGKDAVIFLLKDSYGRDILADMNKLVAPPKIYNVETKKIIELGTNSFVSIKDGNFVFEASYLGETSANTVTVKSQNRKAYEKFRKNVTLFKSTSVNCSACPALGKNLHDLEEDMAAHTIQVSCHGNYGATDPFSVYVGTKDVGSWLMSQFGLNSWPTLIYDMHKAVAGSSMTSEIEKNVFNCLADNPATCGIKVISSECSGDAINVKAKVSSSTGGKYDLGLLVICDGLVYQGGYSENNDGVYNDVLITASNNFAAFASETMKQISKDAEQEFTVSAQIHSKTYESYKDKLELVVVAHRQTADGNSIIDNSVLIPLGKTSEYVLN